jgi:hypothetical protein
MDNNTAEVIIGVVFMLFIAWILHEPNKGV